MMKSVNTDKKMFIRPFLFIILITSLFSALKISPLLAVTTRQWIETNQTDFIKGNLKNISVQNRGSLSLSPFKKITSDIPATYAWCLASNGTCPVFIGTGDPGSIFKISQSGDLTEIFATPEMHIQTLAIDGAGNLFAGTIPHGRIYRITPEGKGKLFCDLPYPYVWDLQFDSNGDLFAATGNNGILYKITQEGIPSVFFDSPSTNILDLVIDQNNNIYAAGEPEGIIYKITRKGNVSVLYDTEEDEIHCLALNNEGILYAGTSSGNPPVISTPALLQPQLIPPPPSPEPELPFDIDTQSYSVVNQPFGTDFGEVERDETSVSPAKNTVYQIDSNDRVSKLLAVEDSFILSLSVDDDNNILVGTGNKAKLFEIDGTKEVSLLYDIRESQILDIHILRDGSKFIATGNNANIYILSEEYSDEGFYESTVYDTSFVSTWGCISWNCITPSETEIKLSTRSGNSRKPDGTWSDWSKEYEKSGEKIISPQARFIQYRIHLRSRNAAVTPSVDSVCIHYLPQNQPPIIEHLEIASCDAEKNDDDYSENREQKRLPATKLLTWKSDDPNGDMLIFDLMYRKAGEESWKTLKSGISNDEQFYWDTKYLPDGYYEVMVIASDIIDNPADLALKGEKRSGAFLIDNTQPSIEKLTKIIKDNDTLTISGNTVDEMCNITEIRYSIDAGMQKKIFPTDNIFDSNVESFQLDIPYESSRGCNVTIEATDAEGNVGSSMKLYIP